MAGVSGFEPEQTVLERLCLDGKSMFFEIKLGLNQFKSKLFECENFLETRMDMVNKYSFIKYKEE